jgi:hypothetical protein
MSYKDGDAKQIEDELHVGRPRFVGNEDTGPFVSGCFRRLRKTGFIPTLFDQAVNL